MELKPGYKQTEVGVIPEDWEIQPLSSLADKIMVGIASAATHAYRDRGIVMFRNQNIKAGYLDVSDVLYIAEDYESAFKNKRLKSGDLLTARTGYPGTTCLVPNNYDGSQSFTTLITRPRNIVDPEYLCIFINSEAGQKYFGQNQIGGGQKNVNAGSLKCLPIALPSTKAEQNSIANALSDADVLIQSLTRLIAKKRQIKQGAMQTLLNPYKNGRLKAGWVVKKLGDVANICRGASPRPIDSPKWFDENSDIGWVRISDITRAKKYLKTTVQKLTAEGVKHSRYVPSSNLIMSICATVGRPILNQIDVCIHDGFVVFGNCTVDKQYLYYFLDSVEQDWSKHGQTGSQMNLNTRLINDTVFPMPKVFSEQTRIATILSDMDAEITALETKLAKYRHIKQGMMQNLLTGRIRLVKPESKTGAVA